MKTFFYDMKALKYYKEDEVKSIILFVCGMTIVSLIGELLQTHKMINPIIDPFLFIWMGLMTLVIPIVIYSVRYFMLDRKMLRKVDKEFDAELKWKCLLHEFNKKNRR